jgi:biopolymer transport protein ExbD
MGIKKRSKVSAEFSMSSLTDIIFLLLIFFMLTSTLVKIQPFELPESDSKTVAPTSAVITVDRSGQFTLNNKAMPLSSIERELRSVVRTMGNREDASVTIVAEKGVPFDNVVKIMEVAGRLRINAILATQPRS